VARHIPQIGDRIESVREDGHASGTIRGLVRHSDGVHVYVRWDDGSWGSLRADPETFRISRKPEDDD
jgi:hypothetical protein